MQTIKINPKLRHKIAGWLLGVKDKKTLVSIIILVGLLKEGFKSINLTPNKNGSFNIDYEP